MSNPVSQFQYYLQDGRQVHHVFGTVSVTRLLDSVAKVVNQHNLTHRRYAVYEFLTTLQPHFIHLIEQDLFPSPQLPSSDIQSALQPVSKRRRLRSTSHPSNYSFLSPQSVSPSGSCHVQSPSLFQSPTTSSSQDIAAGLSPVLSSDLEDAIELEHRSSTHAHSPPVLRFINVSDANTSSNYSPSVDYTTASSASASNPLPSSQRMRFLEPRGSSFSGSMSYQTAAELSYSTGSPSFSVPFPALSGALSTDQPLSRSSRRAEISAEQFQEYVDNRHASSVCDWRNNSFASPPTDVTLQQCVRNFLDLTSNAALRREICVVCSRLLFIKHLRSVTLDSIPSRHLLHPFVPHAKQVLHDDMLLCDVAMDQGPPYYVCEDCHSSLLREKVPKFALANNLWLGPVPFELRTLTLPERLLISIYIPTAYVIKLYPKQVGAQHFNHQSLYDGLQGNVSSHPLPQAEIADLLSNVKPSPVNLLTRTIAITFLTPKEHRDRIVHGTLPGNFTVRRQKVADALLWLKHNNPLWAEVDINRDRLNSLPLNGVPAELEQVVRYSSNLEPLYREHDSYDPLNLSTPVDNDHDASVPYSSDDQEESQSTTDSDSASNTSSPHSDDDESDTHIPPAVISLQNLGVFDVNGNHLNDRDILSHAFANTAESSSQFNRFGIRRGSAFVNEYARIDPTTGERVDGGPSNPAHLLGCFPHLFPYGKGGFELARPTSLSYESQAQWCLQIVDHRFRNESQAFFQMFGVLQKRKICQAASFQVEKSQFQRCRSQLETITDFDLQRASEEEIAHRPFSNPAIRLLRDHVTIVRRQVPGTDENRTLLRTAMWGATLVSSHPSLWVTLNPSDTHNPIAQVLAGCEIDLDHFSSLGMPDSQMRAQTIAQDPYAAALFFQVIIHAILESLFGVKVHSNGQVESQPGVFGTVKHYVGAIEAQGRGTLHAHFLIWLENSPSPAEMKQTLNDPAFRQRLSLFISKNFHADIREKNNEQVERMVVPADLPFSRPTLFNLPNEQSLYIRDQCRLARCVQYHKCSRSRCLQKQGSHLVCKRRAPWRRSRVPWINVKGEWGPKRLCGFLTTWNPTILQCLRANHNVELLLSGPVTQKVIWYITNYATKKQHKSSMASALFTKRLMWHKRHFKSLGRVEALAGNKRLLETASNALSQDRELSAPEVVNYLMGWNDYFISNLYTPLYWGSVELQLIAHFGFPGPIRFNNGHASMQSFTISNQHLTPHDQMKDYHKRPREWESLSFFDFVIETYERTGEPASTTPFQQRYIDHYKSDRYRVYRTAHNDILPKVIGYWFPPNNEENQYPLYCASMLFLFQNHRSLDELLSSYSNLPEAFAIFHSSVSYRIQRIMDNIQSYHDCAKEAHSTDPQSAIRMAPESGLNEEDLYQSDLHASSSAGPLLEQSDRFIVTDAMLAQSRLLRLTPRESSCINNLINVGKTAGLFITSFVNQQPQHSIPEHVSSTFFNSLSEWTKQLKDAIRDDETNGGVFRGDPYHIDEPLSTIPPAVISQDSILSLHTEDGWQSYRAKIASRLPPESTLLCDHLNSEQKKAHNVIINHFLKNLQGQSVPQLLMMVLGEGGTGKSHVIHAVSQGFHTFGRTATLGKVAPTGIAASNIGGSTIHSWAGIKITVPNTDDWAIMASQPNTPEHRRRNEIVAAVQYLIIDEISMVNQKLFHELDVMTREIRKNAECPNYDSPFGGLNVILFGDFYQFPPVKVPKAALYCEPDESRPPPYHMGRDLFLKFTQVVILQEQMRSLDPLWNSILHRQREGLCTAEDLSILRQLVLTNPECSVPDFTQAPWNNPVLVTSRHVIRKMWNSECLRNLSSRTGALRYRFFPEDTDLINQGQPSNEVEYVLNHQNHDNVSIKFEGEIEVVVGMPAMVLFNIATDADIANGTRGEIVDLVLDPREGPLSIEDENVVHLRFPPAALMFKPRQETTLRFEGLTPGLIPLTATSWITSGKDLDGNFYRVRRRQFALTAAYALTDYKSQGQTLDAVLCDIGDPPSGNNITPFNAYVALSRSRGRDTIRFIRDFDERLFTTHPSQSLQQDMRRIELLAARTA